MASIMCYGVRIWFEDELINFDESGEKENKLTFEGEFLRDENEMSQLYDLIKTHFQK